MAGLGDTPAVVPACPFLEGRPVIRQLRRDAWVCPKPDIAVVRK